MTGSCGNITWSPTPAPTCSPAIIAPGAVRGGWSSGCGHPVTHLSRVRVPGASSPHISPDITRYRERGPRYCYLIDTIASTSPVPASPSPHKPSTKVYGLLIRIFTFCRLSLPVRSRVRLANLWQCHRALTPINTSVSATSVIRSPGKNKEPNPPSSPLQNYLHCHAPTSSVPSNDLQH